MAIIIPPRNHKYNEDTQHVTYRNKFGEIVPSVTTILKVINKEALVYWANALGWKKISVKKELDRTSMVGTLVHEYIEATITNQPEETIKNIEFDIDNCLDDESKQEAFNSIESFNKFWDKYKDEYKILTCELPLYGDSYAGTCDIIAKHNGDLCIMDIKTSKQFHFTMFLQLAAYWNLYKKLYNKTPKKVGVLRVDKKDGREAKMLWNEDLKCNNIKYYFQCFKQALDLYRSIFVINDDWNNKE